MYHIPFVHFARARHDIYLRREAGEPSPWTDDPVLHRFRFTNVYRELDATTIWFAKNVRDPMRHSPDVLLATVLFRWFNRIVTGDAIFNQLGAYDNGGSVRTAWNQLKVTHNVDHLEGAIRLFCGNGPYVTGAYIIKTPDGMDKLNGVIWCVNQFLNGVTKTSGGGSIGDAFTLGMELLDTQSWSLEETWEMLRQFPYLGDFMAYEIVTDLRHTDLLKNATDIYSWANPGPGAMRGLNRLHGRNLNHRQPKHVFVCEMRDLLEKVTRTMEWPQNPSGLSVEMRDIEHTLCEFDKYERARLGEGRPRGTYPHG